MLRLFMLSCLLVVTACSPAPKKASDVNASDRTVVGKSMRELQLKGMTGTNFPYAPKPQKPLVVNVWATWCAPCIKELPSLLEMEKKGEFGLLTISIDRDADTVKTYLQNHNLMNLPVVMDASGRSLNEKFSLRGVPTTYFVDTDWVVRGIELGEREWAHPSMMAKIRNAVAVQE